MKHHLSMMEWMHHLKPAHHGPATLAEHKEHRWMIIAVILAAAALLIGLILLAGKYTGPSEIRPPLSPYYPFGYQL